MPPGSHGALRPSAVLLHAAALRRCRPLHGLFDPKYDRNFAGPHQKRPPLPGHAIAERVQEKQWNPKAQRIQMRKVPYTSSSVAELMQDTEEVVPGVHRDFLEPRHRRYVNRVGILCALVAISLYTFTIWRFGQETFDDVIVPDQGTGSLEVPAQPAAVS
eukprot:TRINITY_DN72298_c0_g1_i1.p2 TRINITY_DN72298_c0_g1~~TRINITY_DN72298_c0_g1_i1.p2  ORF type:complete len:187 (+),score=50.51 TRINITY_DN72298_c0_g1_i1:82-561(+)